MIFVTVGAQMPFNRMVKAVDEWALENERDDIFAQIGPTDWTPNHIDYTDILESREFFEKFESADAIVAHAGMGSILSALQKNKPILVMPRQGNLRETRNDHQVATANRLHEIGKVEVAFDASELKSKLDTIEDLRKPEMIGPYASPELLDAIRSFINRA